MSENDKQALVANFDIWRSERASHLEKDVAFEYFTCGEILKDFDLTDEEIESGIIGGSNDGGIDGFYFFVDDMLTNSDQQPNSSPQYADLYLIQSKQTKGFSEEAVTKFQTFLVDLFELDTPVVQYTYLSTRAQEAISDFRRDFKQVRARIVRLSIHVCYATLSTGKIHKNVLARAEKLKSSVNKSVTADVNVSFWGVAEILASRRSIPKMDFLLPTANSLSVLDGSFVCLVSLTDYKLFLSDKNDTIRETMLAPNVRDYQGKSNRVNKEIRTTLESSNSREFWWLNNGVTVIADSCSLAGGALKIRRPQIVNGLQTSREIFSYFEAGGDDPQSRHILVRVLIPKDEVTRNEIIRATNNQTKIPAISLHATDKVHFDIKDALAEHDLFYDRRKGECKRVKNPIDRIVSIPQLAQSVIAILLQFPDEARARPQSYLNKDNQASKVFSEKIPLDLYTACTLTLRHVDSYLKSDSTFDKDLSRNIRFHIAMWAVAALCNSPSPKATEIALLLDSGSLLIPNKLLKDAASIVRVEFAKFGGSDSVAKGKAFTAKLKAMLRTRIKGPSPKAKIKATRIARP